MNTTILENINGNIDKNYTKFKFVSNDVLPLNILINIHTLSIVTKYQQVYRILIELIFLKVLTLKNVMKPQENVVYASIIIF